MSPSRISTTGGTRVSIQGRGFGDGTTVSIGGAVITPDASSTSSLLIVTVPARPAGPATVVVSRAGQSASGTVTVVAPVRIAAPPTLSNLRTTGSRPGQPSLFGDIGESLQVAITVANASDLSLQYSWTVGAGTVTGSGSTVTWQLPASMPSLPSSVDVSVAAVGTWTEDGVEHRQESRLSGVARVHDSPADVMDKGFAFLDRFSLPQYSVDDVLVDFSHTCDGGRGRRDEKDDVEKDRRKYIRLPGYTVTRVPPVTFNFGGACAWTSSSVRRGDACATFDVRWLVEYREDFQDRDLGHIPRGTIEESIGRDYVSAVYEENTWRLCHSAYEGTRTVTYPDGRRVSGVRVER